MHSFPAKARTFLNIIHLVDFYGQKRKRTMTTVAPNLVFAVLHWLKIGFDLLFNQSECENKFKGQRK